MLFSCLRGLLGILLPVVVSLYAQSARAQARPPNILLAISDDQSYPHASAYGTAWAPTPAFDRIAREGVLFTNAFVASPGCSPSRAALLTGRYPWQLAHAGTHASTFPAAYVVFPDLLEQAGYAVGYTGKGWGPGDWEASGRPRNPAGPAFNEHTQEAPAGVSGVDYAANFAAFLETRAEGQPFYFWYGGHEPHRRFEPGIGAQQGGHPGAVAVPAFLPDLPEVRADLLDYAAEIAWFDRHLARMLTLLEERGELDNTLVVVTSDNGMAFPRAKANTYEYGLHVPLAVRWPASVPGGRVVDDLVSLVDLAPTLLEAAGAVHPDASVLAGRSMLDLLRSGRGGQVEPGRTAVYAGRERHSSSRYGNLGYPQRALRTPQYLYVRNLRPERWPAGAPRAYGADGTLGPMHGAYHDIDAAPTLDALVAHTADPALARYLFLAVAHRPAEELYDVRSDPACLRNLALEPAYQDVAARHREQLAAFLAATGDPRAGDGGDVFETYERRAGPMRSFPVPAWALPGHGRD